MTKTQATVTLFLIALFVATVVAWKSHHSRSVLLVPVEGSNTVLPIPSDPCLENPSLGGCAKG